MTGHPHLGSQAIRPSMGVFSMGPEQAGCLAGGCGLYLVVAQVLCCSREASPVSECEGPWQTCSPGFSSLTWEKQGRKCPVTFLRLQSQVRD